MHLRPVPAVFAQIRFVAREEIGRKFLGNSREERVVRMCHRRHNSIESKTVDVSVPTAREPDKNIRMQRALNFNAGPATLPLPALERAQRELLDFAGTGMSVMEHSHRGKEYEAVHDEAIALLRELCGISADYDVLFLQGGASMQFAVVPMNLLTAGKSADYVVTGVWGEKAFAEAQIVAKQFGQSVHLAASTGSGDGPNAKEKTYARTPAASEMTLDANRSEERRVGKECKHWCRSRWSPYH